MCFTDPKILQVILTYLNPSMVETLLNNNWTASDGNVGNAAIGLALHMGFSENVGINPQNLWTIIVVSYSSIFNGHLHGRSIIFRHTQNLIIGGHISHYLPRIGNYIHLSSHIRWLKSPLTSCKWCFFEVSVLLTDLIRKFGPVCADCPQRLHVVVTTMSFPAAIWTEGSELMDSSLPK